MSRHTRPTTVVSQARMFSNGRGIVIANPQPCLLQGVVGFANQPEHPVGDRAEVRPVLLEPVSHDFDRLGADEDQRGGVAVREGRQDRGNEIDDVHIPWTRVARRT